jgi:hypothetical protein
MGQPAKNPSQAPILEVLGGRATATGMRGSQRSLTGARSRSPRASKFFIFLNLHRSDLAKHFEAKSSLILPLYAITKGTGVIDCKDRI